MKAYLDNAATTPLDPEVMDAMLPVLKDVFGNPSSIHASGRQAKTIIERSRKAVADILGASPAEIFFTSGGTESNNTVLSSTVETYGIRHIITSPLEHHAVLHTVEHLKTSRQVRLSYLDVDHDGQIDIRQLEELLSSGERALVSLMHANNEIGNIYDIATIAECCKSYDAIYHTDTVQTMGHFRHDLKQLKTDFIVGAAHKFHGPKGVGFFYQRAGNRIRPFIHGGAQERNMRGGTENIYGIVGMAKALEIAYRDMDAHREDILKLKLRMKEKLQAQLGDIKFNGLSGDPDKSLYTVLNVSLPPTEISDMLLFNLDIAGISASGGSACASGTDIGSHVLQAIQADPDRPSIRFSFSKFTTTEETDYAADFLAQLFQKSTV